MPHHGRQVGQTIVFVGPVCSRTHLILVDRLLDLPRHIGMKVGKKSFHVLAIGFIGFTVHRVDQLDQRISEIPTTAHDYRGTLLETLHRGTQQRRVYAAHDHVAWYQAHEEIRGSRAGAVNHLAGKRGVGWLDDGTYYLLG